MKTTAEIRRENLAALVREAGTQTKLATMIGRDKRQVGQWLGKKGAREVNHETARLLEEIFHKERGWMDNDHSMSHLLGYPIEIMTAAIEWLAGLSDEAGLSAEIMGDPVYLAAAVEMIVKEKAGMPNASAARAFFDRTKEAERRRNVGPGKKERDVGAGDRVVPSRKEPH